MASSEATGVVNNKGQVFGTKNLRVADVSIVPTNSRGNTQALAYLVGNIIADKILRHESHEENHHHSHSSSSDSE